MGINIEKSFKTFLKTLIESNLLYLIIIFIIYTKFYIHYFEMLISGELGLA